MNSVSFKPNIERDFGELKSISLMMCSFITTKLNFLVELLTINVFFYLVLDSLLTQVSGTKYFVSMRHQFPIL